MSNSVRGYIRTPGTGAGINAVTVSAKLHNGDSSVTTDATNSAGLFEIDHDTLGYPGPFYLTATSGSTTDIVSGNVSGQVNGLFYLADLNDALTALGLGVMPDYLDELEVTASGADMNVDIAAGMVIHKDGLPYILEATDDVTISAADGSNPRIDTIVITQTREGQTEQGKMVLAVVTGTPASSPSAPSLTQTSATWMYPLADVLVGTGVSVIAADKITDRRTYCLRWPETVTPNQFVKVDSDGLIAFDTVSVNDAATIGDGSVSNTEFQYLNGVTSAIQTQLNAKVADYTQYLGASVNLGNGTDVITSAEPAVDFELPETCTLVRASIEKIAGSAGNLRINVAKAAAGSTSYSNIDASAPLQLSAASLNDDTTLTGWTTAVTQYDKYRVTVDGAVTPTNITRARISFAYTKSRS